MLGALCHMQSCIQKVFRIVIISVLVFPTLVFAETMTSPNFQVQGGTFGGGGTESSTSSNFTQQSVLGGPTLGDDTLSANFQTGPGFQEIVSSGTTPSPSPSPSGGGGGGSTPTPPAPPQTLLPPTAQACNGADFNADGLVDLIDFGTLVFFWNQSNPSNACVDINSDTIVDLIDFGTLVFEWTG